jgi:hypothetical protein
VLPRRSEKALKAALQEFAAKQKKEERKTTPDKSIA